MIGCDDMGGWDGIRRYKGKKRGRSETAHHISDGILQNLADIIPILLERMWEKKTSLKRIISSDNMGGWDGIRRYKGKIRGRSETAHHISDGLLQNLADIIPILLERMWEKKTS